MVTTRSKTGKLPEAAPKLIDDLLSKFKPKKSTRATKKKATTATKATKATTATKATKATTATKTKAKTTKNTPKTITQKPSAKPKPKAKAPPKKTLTAAETRAEAAKKEKEALVKEKLAAAVKKELATARREAAAAKRAAAAKDKEAGEKKRKGPTTKAGRISKSKTPSPRVKISPTSSNHSFSGNSASPQSPGYSPEEISEQASRNVGDHATRYSIQLNCKSEITQFCRVIGDLPEVNLHGMGRGEKMKMAAALVFFASHLLRQPKGLADIAESTNISEGAIRIYYLVLCEEDTSEEINRIWVDAGKVQAYFHLLPRMFTGATRPQDSDDSSS
ncbi:MAG: hypothetical protein M1812_000235 [Candelaria pacifica]|nr:MAG: hypothetical protein M1812_000235 [Candelaria pacifica]